MLSQILRFLLLLVIKTVTALMEIAAHLIRAKSSQENALSLSFKTAVAMGSARQMSLTAKPTAVPS